MNLFFDQIPGFVSGILVTIIGGYFSSILIKRKDRKQDDQKNKNEFFNIKKQVIEECDFNITPEVGDAKCNFHFEAHKVLLNHNLSSTLGEKIPPLLKDIIHSAALCNSYGGLRQLEKPPGTVKNMSKDLKNLLMNVDCK